ncbi:MAG TPA: hypothetical protein VMM13_11940, partial [Euzebya sp.]|nr:hypothetical protein [Euzebya sp.]
VVAAGLGVLTALPLGLTSLADRAGAGKASPGQAARAVATLLAAGTVVAAALAVVQGISVQVATQGGVQPTIAGTAAPGIFGLAALVVLLAASGGWRVGQQPPTQADQPSRYTVEAVRGDVGPTSDQGEHDEWDLAVDDEGNTAPPAGARP